MITYDSLIIHYGELSTKGENKRLFIRTLLHNVKDALDNPKLTYSSNRDHIVIGLNDEDKDPIVARLQEVSGIQRISLVHLCESQLESIQKDSLGIISLEEGKTFKIETKRSDDSFPLHSYDLTVAVADYILDHTSLKVDIHHPDIVLNINLRKSKTSLCCHDYPGLGGYPLGCDGKATMLLSGGIDSPVAAYSLIRRGIKIECLHFAAPPYTSERVIDKLTDLLFKLNAYQSDIRLDVVPFTKLQVAIYDNVDEPFAITVMRRMMMRIAVGVAKKHHCLAIATGESIGQVASQTLESMDVINEVTNFPIIRPLVVSDKLSIISLAKKIDTYDISIRPYEDCCTIFKPKAPKTKPKLEYVLEFEKKFDWQTLVDECIANTKPIFVSKGKVVEGKDK